MAKIRVRHFFHDETLMPFGPYTYRKLKDVPKDYLLRLLENKDKQSTPRELIEWIKHHIKDIKPNERQLMGQKIIQPQSPLLTKLKYCSNKKTFPNEKEAKFRLKNLSNEKHRHPIRAYECNNCGGWHLTSKPNIYKWTKKAEYNFN